MTVTVFNVQKSQARAVQIPETLTNSDIDDVLYGFGFEYFGDNFGTQRLVHIADDCLEDYDDAKDVMVQANTELALYDRDERRWVPLLPGDWVVEPKDDRGDGFIRLSDLEFHESGWYATTEMDLTSNETQH
jgi:hypothetical protein